MQSILTWQVGLKKKRNRLALVTLSLQMEPTEDLAALYSA